MEKCHQHNKTANGNCCWCGKALCDACVGKVVRNKLYCSKCSTELGPIIKKMQFTQLQEEKKEEVKQEHKKFFDFNSIIMK